MKKEILIRVHVPEEYQDCHPTIIFDDFLNSADDVYWKAELVSSRDSTDDLEVSRRQAKRAFHLVLVVGFVVLGTIIYFGCGG